MGKHHPERSRFWQTVDDFYPRAKALRKVFDTRFAEPCEATEERFVWDYWHVPEQYTLVRTPAYHYFEEKLYHHFQDALCLWGQQNLGCQSISPPWLSYYVDGCRQELHADIPHGPFAFVYSLSPWDTRVFKGGETLLLKPEVLSYWSSWSTGRGLESSDLQIKIPALFNRLTVFDPRLPHGVVPVEGTRDPRQARLVIHGWFTEPKPFISAAASNEEEITSFLNDELERLYPRLGQAGSFSGLLSVRLSWSSSRRTPSAQVLMNTLVDLDQPLNEPKKIEKLILKFLTQKKWPAVKRATEVTIPFIFA